MPPKKRNDASPSLPSKSPKSQHRIEQITMESGEMFSPGQQAMILDEMVGRPPSSFVSPGFQQQILDEMMEEALDSSFVSESESEDANDSVVRRIPMYFSKQVDLFLVQYPTKQREFPPGYHPRRGRIKPKSQVIELEVPLVTDYNFSQPRAEEMARHYNSQIQAQQAMTGRKRPMDPNVTPLGIPEEHLESQVFASSPIPMSANYVAGIIRNGQLHMTPLQGYLNMRPNLAYLDKEKEKKPTKGPTKKEEEEEEEGVEQNRIVQLQVKRQDLDGPSKETAARIAQNTVLTRQAEEEPWMVAQVEGHESYASQAIVNQMLGNLMAPAPHHVTSLTDYVNDMAPIATVDKEKRFKDEKSEPRNLSHALAVTKGMTWAQIRPLPLTAQIKALLINAKILPWRRIREVIDYNHSDNAILEQLLVVGSVVQGNWTIKSALLYSGRAQHARTILLQMFGEQRYVKRDSFMAQTLLPLEMATNMLKEIAVWERDVKQENRARSMSVGAMQDSHDHKTGHWVLKLPRDGEMVQLYPDIVRRATEAFMVEKTNALNSLAALQPPSKKIPKKIPVAQPVSSAPSGSMVLSGASTQAAESKPEKKKAVQAVDSEGLHFPCYQYPVIGVTAEEQAKEFVLQLFDRYGVCDKQFIKHAFMTRISDADAASHGIKITQSYTTDDKLNTILEELCVPVQGRFVRRNVNNTMDDHRHVLISLFQKKANLKKQEIAAAFAEHKLSEPGPAQYQKLIKEMASYTSPWWTLKKGDGSE